MHDFVQCPTLNANMLFTLNFCPIEYTVQKHQEEEGKVDEKSKQFDVLSVGLLTHSIMPILYYLIGCTNKHFILSAIVDRAYNHPDKMTLFAESYTNASTLLDRIFY